MYKVITHTISEQHFDSPVAAAHGMATYCGTNLASTMTTSNNNTNSSSYSSNVTKLDYDPLTNTWDGTLGDMAVGPNYVYLCVGNNSWTRWAHEPIWGTEPEVYTPMPEEAK